ncbi:trypsin-like serine protease [Marinicella meishanensis]|uniref:trypsin-like serine protease n=1 Tax=Marinicella meishanensis TaxID=2873263 RepID=UPI001CBD1121|nr:trypsin-like serine protease [Marinicella sp. NBU2979]
MKILYMLWLLVFAGFGQAVVMRHDVPPESYALKTAPDFLIDMPHEGSAVLIDPQWLLSAGHVVYDDSYVGQAIFVHGVEHTMAQVIFHPNYKKMPDQPFTGDAQPLMDFLYGRSDLVLIKLTEPVTHAEPIKRYRGDDELGKITTTYGKGATGTGITGEKTYTKMHRPLNHFNNRIDQVLPNHLLFRFDRPEQALPLEGTVGSGDSGGPTVIMVEGEPQLIGIQCFRDFKGDLADFKGGVYDSTAVLCRVSSHNPWIDAVIGQGPKAQ